MNTERSGLIQGKFNVKIAGGEQNASSKRKLNIFFTKCISRGGLPNEINI